VRAIVAATVVAVMLAAAPAGAKEPVWDGSPDAPAPESASVLVEPSTDLVHGQEVKVKGLGFVPGSSVGFAQCDAENISIEGCDLSNIGFATTNANGKLRAFFTVKRILDNGLDCAKRRGRCVLGVGESGPEITVPLSFDPSVPPPPPPVLLVEPNRDLVHRQVVQVHGEGFAPGELFALQQCLRSDPPGECGGPFLDGVQADDTGAFTSPFTVQRKIRNVGGTIDCARQFGECVIRTIRWSGLGPDAEVEIGFDPNSPLPEVKVRVRPATDLVDRQLVHVVGKRFTPFQGISAVHCLSSTDPSTLPRTCGESGYGSADVNGRVKIDVPVRRLLTRDNGTKVDCAERPGKCSMFVSSSFDPVEAGTIKLEFDPDVPPAPPPTLTVRPRNHLHGGQVVTVIGGGFTPGVSIGFTQCTTGATDIGDCDLSFVQYATAAPDGGFSGQFTVRRRIFTSDGEIRCGAEPEACVIGAANINDILGENATATISFAPRS
jgi:neocarzinostatin family protein